MGIKVANNAYGTLNAGISNVATTLVLNSGEGSRFPTLSAGDYFYATLIDTSNNLEIVKVTASATDTLTIVRAQDNTTARAFSANDRFELRPTAALFNELILANMGLFKKADPTIVAWAKTGAGTATTSSTLYIEVNGSIKTIASGTSITMPTLSAGTDYAIWAKTDGTLEATSNHTSPPTANARKVGGFHYAPGGNAAAVAGGDTTPQINEYSFWDLKFRPKCSDPRGMTLVTDSFWADIYLLGVDHLTNGTSKYNVSIADGSAPPKIPTKFGGTGSNAYSTLDWWVANEVLQSWGKRSPTYDEFAALAYGTTEATSIGGSDVPTTGVSGTGATNAWNKFTSRWGVIQATGCMWIWGANFGGGAAVAGGTANTQGRGSTYQLSNADILGGSWLVGASSGSRASIWSFSPTISYSDIGARGVCDHLEFE